MVKGRLIYTTEQSKMADNIEVFDEQIGQQARAEARATIDFINKTRRRACIMGKGTKDIARTTKEITDVIEWLSVKGMAFDELYNKFYNHAPRENKKVKRLNNVLQTIRMGSDDIVASKKKQWRIDPAYVSGKQELLKKVLSNLNARWAKAPKRQRERAAQPPVVKKEMLPTASARIVFSHDQKPLDIPINIVITVKVHVEK